MTTENAKLLTDSGLDEHCVMLVQLMQKLPEGNIDKLRIIRSLVDILTERLRDTIMEP